MIDIRRLKYISDHNNNDVLRFVADYILRKTQRDYTEFFRYRYKDDWKELDAYLTNVGNGENPKDIEAARKLIYEVIDAYEIGEDELSFEKELLNHWHGGY